MFGGNSNWRGPVWFPMNVLLIRALFQFHAYYGDAFRVECPTGSGRLMTLFEVATEISDRLQRIFLRDDDRPASGVRRHGEVPERSALARLHSLPRVLPRRQRRRPRRQPSDRVDRAGRRSLVQIVRDRRCPHRARVSKKRVLARQASVNRSHGPETVAVRGVSHAW